MDNLRSNKLKIGGHSLKLLLNVGCLINNKCHFIVYNQIFCNEGGILYYKYYVFEIFWYYTF